MNKNSMSNRKYLLAPRTIAVLGASRKPGIGKAIVDNLLAMGFTGRVYAVNVRGESIGEIPGFSSVMDIPGDVDTAVLAVPSRYVLTVAEECGRKGVKAMICISAGFREVGGDGESAEKKLVSIADKYGMCFVGPNCMGVINTDAKISLNATINSMLPRKGNVAMLTQSGALGAALMDFAEYLDIGFSMIVSTGNQADMNICDFLELAEEDANTRVVLLYMEGIPEPVRFRKIVRSMKKPVVVLKSGRTGAGAKAAGSHTGSLAENDAVADAVLRQAGCIRAASLEDAYLLTMTLSKVDRPKGRRIGIVSNTGGIDILLADALTERGFELSELPDSCMEELRSVLMPEASIRNPMDIVAPASPMQYEAAVRAMIFSGAYDAVIVVSVPAATVDTGEVGRRIAPTLLRADIPVLTCFYGPGVGEQGKREMRKNGIATFDYPEKIAEILNYICPREHPVRENRPFTADMSCLEECRRAFESCEEGFLPVKTAEKILRCFGIPVAGSEYIREETDIDSLRLQYPVAAKIDHPQIIHKSDVGGVRMNIGSPEELKSLLRTWKTRFPELRGALIQEQVSGDTETIVGAVLDPALGHGVAVGMGGKLVELLKDVSFGHVPVTETDAAEMLTRLKCYPVYEGYRGSERTDTGQLEEIIVCVSRMLSELPQIQELDINPLIFDRSRKKFIAVDFRIRK